MSQKSLVVLLTIAVALLAGYLVLSVLRGPAPPGLKGNTEPNRRPEIDRVISSEERARMERYIEELEKSKRVVKSFIGPSGETIDCVDIYHQPALMKPGMEDHQVQLAPSTWPSEDEKEPFEAAKEKAPPQLYTITGESCPELSFPMRRLTMETLQRFETLDDFFKKQSQDIEKPCDGDTPSGTHEYAHAARTVDNWGAESILNLWNPFVDETYEFSLSQIWVVRGSGAKQPWEEKAQVERQRINK